MGLSCTVSEIDGDFSRKSHHLYFAPRWRDSPWNWVPALGSESWNDGATGPTKKFDDIFSCLDTMHERDRHFPLLHRERGTSCRLNWKEQNQHLLFAEDWKRFFSIVHPAPNNTWYNDYVMRPRSYSTALRNTKIYVNVNVNRRTDGWTDRRTDRHRATAKTALAHSVAR